MRPMKKTLLVLCLEAVTISITEGKFKTGSLFFTTVVTEHKMYASANTNIIIQ